MTSVVSSPRLDVPSFYCPFPYAISPEADAVDRATVQWMDDFGLFRSPEQRQYLAAQRIGHCAALALPHGRGEGLRLAADYVFWLFTFDDMYCDERVHEMSLDAFVQFVSKLTRIVEAPTARILTDDPWAEGLRDIRLRMERTATPVQLARWVEEQRKYLFGLIWETANRLEGRIPPVDDYVTMWLNASACGASVMFVDISAGYEVSADDMADSRVRALTEMANAIIAWDNDLISFNKESYRQHRYGYPQIQNLVSVLTSGGRSVEAASAEAVRMRDRVMTLFLRVADEVRADASPELDRYVYGLGEWIRGYLAWAMSTGRYLDPRNPTDRIAADPVTMPGTWKERASDDRLDPLPLPAITWWWDQLGAR